MRQYQRVMCADTYTVSVQANEGAYCSPRDNEGPYTHVELGFPSSSDCLITAYAEEKDKPTDTVYGYVPAAVVELLIVKHGGAVSGEVPDGVLMLMAPPKEKDENK